jgi:hypothetical protein
MKVLDVIDLVRKLEGSDAEDENLSLLKAVRKRCGVGTLRHSAAL